MQLLTHMHIFMKYTHTYMIIAASPQYCRLKFHVPHQIAPHVFSGGSEGRLRTHEGLYIHKDIHTYILQLAFIEA